VLWRSWRATKEQEIKRLILINGDDLGLGVATTKPM
jgi:hypothetical protein